MTEMNMDDPYKWPQISQESYASVNKAAPEQVIRYHLSYNDKLVPVTVVVEKAGIGTDRWASDDYHIHCEESGILTVMEKASGVIVKMYNASRWLSLWYEYQDGYKWWEAKNVVVMDKEEADAHQS